MKCIIEGKFYQETLIKWIFCISDSIPNFSKLKHYYRTCSTQCLCLTFLWFQSMRMPIHWAASGGHTDMVEYLLNFNVPVDVRDEVKS